MKLDSVIVVGAGIVGLSTAYFLQERDVDVTVVDRVGVGAGSSWGNAGQLAPALTVPLPAPETFAYGMGALFNRSSAFSVPLAMNLSLVRFLLGFVRHCTPEKWRSAMAVYTELNRSSMAAFDELIGGGVEEPTVPAEPFLNAFRSVKDRDVLVKSLDAVTGAGGAADYDLVSGAEIRSLEPVLGTNVGAGLRLYGQRYLHPPRFLDALADAVRARGGRIVSGFSVDEVRELQGTRVQVISGAGESLTADAVVLATGAWLGDLARGFGVRQTVQAGRGYSFSVIPDAMPTHPIDFPAQHVACTPLGDKFRISGIMELRSVAAKLNPRRIAHVIEAARPLLAGIDWDSRTDEWVGSRPCTADGLPLIGATRSPRVYVGGGHGMWGVTLGPLTGKYLAALMTQGNAPELVRNFDPLR
jgi:D-amino-acid dehydrogenase